MPTNDCSRFVMFAKSAMLVNRRHDEWNCLDHERGRSLRLGRERELRYFFAVGQHEIGSRELHVLNERRSFERLHEARERLYVDGVSNDLEIDVLDRSE